MKHFKHLFFILFIFNFSILFAGPGDTIVVQTFEFEGYPVGSGWLSPREGFFDFTTVDDLSFSKVLMYYTLKCDDSQSPACGEWDYLSYVKMMEYTGRGEDPSFIVGGQGGYTQNSFSFMNDISWWYQGRVEETITWDNPTAFDEYEVGNGTIDLDNPFNATLDDSRTMYLWKATQLNNSGLPTGEITAMQFNFSAVGDKMKKLNIRIKHTTDEFLTEDVDTTGFITVYSKDTQIDATGWQTFNFTNFFTWDGTSNILVDIYFTGDDGTSNYTIVGKSYAEDVAVHAGGTDNYFDFYGPDLIPLSTDNLSSINNEITIAFWQYGNPQLQPQNDCIFEAINADGKRVLNVHLPWGNGNVYWDSGDDTGYDRIEIALAQNQYKGQWNHWAFTKNVNDGSMKMYLNGQLLQSGTGKNRNIDIIDTMAIGRGLSDITVSNARFYAGSIDEFQVWNTELDEATIASWMYKEIDASHPDYASLIAYYKFNETSGYTTTDEIFAYQSPLRGIPQRKNFDGLRFKNFETSTLKPNVKFIYNTSGYTIATEVVVDSFPKEQVQIDKYVQPVADEKPVLDETIYVYPTYYNNYVYDANGIATDSTEVIADETLILEMFGYNTTAPEDEIVIAWEIGRFITPYGNGLDLGEDGWTWIFDVTDFQHILHGDNVHIKAGNFQELLDMKFIFIEGTPARDLLSIENVYSGNYQLSNFDEKVTDSTITLMPEGEMFQLKTTLTGHGFGTGANCGEFCPNTHSVDVNGNQEYSWEIIQQCGSNPLYPQGGTWFYDRAGWCPGMPATVQNLDITPFINVGIDTEVVVDYDIETDPYGNYITEIFFVTYGDYNFTTDAAIEEIIAPNEFKLQERFNPICGRPIIKIKNNGSTNLTSLTVDYGIAGQEPYTYNWTGNLGFLEEEEIILPTMDTTDFYNASQNLFEVTISNPNGTTDEYLFNNSLYSTYDVVDNYSTQLVIRYRTNSRYWENSYTIFDANGDVVFSRNFDEANIAYVDTLELTPGCYEFVAYDSGGDGMYNWPSGHGTGYIKFYDVENTYFLSLEEWFGNYVRYNFIQHEYPVEIKNIKEPKINIFPNPSSGIFNIEFISKTNDYSIEVYTLTGRTVYTEQIENQKVGLYNLDLTGLNSGFYIINIKSENINVIKKIIIE